MCENYVENKIREEALIYTHDLSQLSLIFGHGRRLKFPFHVSHISNGILAR